MTTVYYPGDGFDKFSQQIADSLSGLEEGSHTILPDGNIVDNPPTLKGNNDEYDAYRHLLLAAKLTEAYGAGDARTILDSHEGYQINPSREQNMDRWNNDVGINSYQEWKNASDAGQTTDSLEKWLYDKVVAGETINNPYDPRESRVYDGPKIEPQSWWSDNSLQFQILLKNIFGAVLDFIIPPAYGNDINPLANDLFNTAQNWTPPRRDPLTLDLDGDGLETVGANLGIVFDHDADGIKTGTGWVAADDGFIKSNGQLAVDGFDALREAANNCAWRMAA